MFLVPKKNTKFVLVPAGILSCLDYRKMLHEAVIDSVSLIMELLIHGRNLVTSLTDKKILKEVQIINYVVLLQNASKSGTKQIWNTQVIVIHNMSHRAHMKSVDPN